MILSTVTLINVNEVRHHLVISDYQMHVLQFCASLNSNLFIVRNLNTIISCYTANKTLSYKQQKWCVLKVKLC